MIRWKPIYKPKTDTTALSGVVFKVGPIGLTFFLAREPTNWSEAEKYGLARILHED